MKYVGSFLRRLLSFRYELSIKGENLLKTGKTRLVLPSHVALVDPLIITALFSSQGTLRPLASRKYFDRWRVRPFFKLVKAVPVEEFDHDKGSAHDAEEMMEQVHTYLAQHQSILLYPQGELAAQGYQSIVGKRSAFLAAKHLPADTQIITVTIRGLRGSRSSRARNGKGPQLFPFLIRGGLSLLANLFIFTPKHKVEITIHDATTELKKVANKGIDAFNSQLEKIYNAEGEEPIQYVSALARCNTVKNRKTPMHIVGSRESLRKQGDYSAIKYPEKTLDVILTTLRKIKEDPSLTVTLNTNLVLDLFLDSLDMVEVKSAITNHFPTASNPPLMDIKTVGDLVLMAMGQTPLQENLKPCEWNFLSNPTPITKAFLQRYDTNANILEVMKKSFKNLKNTSVCYDQLFGVQSTKDFLMKAYLIAGILRKLPDKNIGILLPSLSATSMLVVACYLAEKIPVMLNRTQSKEGFKHCLKVQEVKVILTAKSFFQKIQTPRLKKYEMTYVEELLKDISMRRKVSAFVQARRGKIPEKLDETAVVLFTSGSEALPKAVALTHQNILSDIAGALGRIKIRQDDVLLAFLPPFHSFGFTVNTILPLVTGIRSVNTPDPNDTFQLSSLIAHTKVTVITSTPTFFKQMLEASHKDQLTTLRLVMTGAEKAPEELLDLMKQKTEKTELLEGYGITECSPIISVGQKPGNVGLPVVGAKILILSQETEQEVKTGEEGMIYVSGPFVFNGYVDPTLESPFQTNNGKKFYKTGDIGYLDREGNLHISGRLKRFVKIAGEMISIPAIEEVLQKEYASETLQIALEAKEKADGTATFVVFATKKLETKAINSFLRQEGISNLVKISKVKVIEEIPLLGTGKADFMKLREMID